MKHKYIEDLLVNLPLIELHVHLEAGVSADFYVNLAQKNQIRESEYQTLAEMNQNQIAFKDFNHFIRSWAEASLTIRNTADIRKLVNAFFKQRVSENICYTEAHFSPLDVSICRKFFSPNVEALALEEVIFTLLGAISEAETENQGTTVKIILDTLWPSGVSENQTLINLLSSKNFRTLNKNKFNEPIVVGIGMGGPERYKSLLEKSALMTAYKNLGFYIDLHCGETASFHQFKEVIEVLKPHRISHGIAGAQHNVFFAGHTALCPQSNCLTGVWPKDDFAQHPAAQLLKQKKSVSLNSDDPLFFGYTLRQTLWECAHGFSLHAEDIIHSLRAAAENVFCPGAFKRVYKAGIYMPNNFFFPLKSPGLEQ